MSGACTFFSEPTGIKIDGNSCHNYVLLTAADGINDSFQLLVVDPYGWSMKVQAGSSCGTWGPVMYGSNDNLPAWCSLKSRSDPAILHGGVIHWLACLGKQILSYNLGTRKSGSVELPPTKCDIHQLHLTTSSDGKRLKLLGIEGFMITVWLQLPISATCGGDWVLETMFDMEEKLRLLYPCNPFDMTYYGLIVLHCFEKSSGDVVLLRVPGQGYLCTVIVDLEMKDMRRHKSGTLLEINLLPSRLENLKNHVLAS
jgi:hypothetical protein